MDGIFDSGFVNAGNSSQRQFTELGDFYYFCSLHDWMNGVVHVVNNPGTAPIYWHCWFCICDNGLGFEVKYILDTNLQKAVHVNPDDESLIFIVSGNTGNEQI